MFVFNLNLNKNKISKIILILACVLVMCILVFACIKIFNNNSTFKINDKIVAPDVIELNTNNYTNILQTVHEDLDSYIGKNISFSGYVYRLYDFTDNEFVLARNMLVSSDYKTLVVGFLCNYKDISKYPDNTWVKITGKITKGDYHGEIPVIEITKLEKIEKPSDEYVYPPDDFYIPTYALF